MAPSGSVHKNMDWHHVGSLHLLERKLDPILPSGKSNKKLPSTDDRILIPANDTRGLIFFPIPGWASPII